MRRLLPVLLIPTAALLLASRVPVAEVSAAPAAALRCTMRPGTVRIVGVVEDTTPLTAKRAPAELMSMSSVAPGPADSLLATDATLFPTAWVRVSHLDASTRAALAALGVTDATPRVIVQARPYRADCRDIRWTEAEPWTVPSPTSQYFLGATLAPREYWHNDTPTFVVHGGWQSPYPRHLSGLPTNITEFAPTGGLQLVAGLTRDALAPATDRFVFDTALARDPSAANALAWARANLVLAEREPMRSMVRQRVLLDDASANRTKRSRYAGEYLVAMALGADTVRWRFRTDGQLTSAHREWNAEVTTAQLLAAPYSVGHTLPGWGAAEGDTVPMTRPNMRDTPRRSVWWSVRDPMVAPDTSAQSTRQAELLFSLYAVPPRMWEQLTPWYREERALPAGIRMPPRDPGTLQVLVPLTVERTAAGVVRGEARLPRGERALWVRVERVQDETSR